MMGGARNNKQVGRGRWGERGLNSNECTCAASLLQYNDYNQLTDDSVVSVDCTLASYVSTSLVCVELLALCLMVVGVNGK